MYPEQKRRGQAKENWRRVRSINPLTVGFIIKKYVVLTLTLFDNEKNQFAFNGFFHAFHSIFFKTGTISDIFPDISLISRAN
jgi:hypothetical protein